MFREFSPKLNNGTYIFVAKHSINEVTYDKLKSDCTKVLNNSKAIKSS